VIDGIDDSLASLKWKRFATGLHQPLGLKVVGDKVYTVGHDQITRLHDVDGDGEADFYENYNDDWELTTAFHAFCFDLHTDKDGNFSFAFGGPVRSGGGSFHKITSHHGTIMKVSPDGKKLEVYATGFRAPNGIGLNVETGQVTAGDNEGTWVPKCPIHWVKPGSFNGVMDMAHGKSKGTPKQPAPEDHPKPLCWMPKNIDNSGGGQVWVTSDRWGPFKGQLLHMSYGTSSLYKVLYETVNGQVQGGVAKFPLRFTSSAMRARFNERDGQLYVAGLRGWQSNAATEGGFDRVRYTGAPVRMPTALHVKKTSVAVTFTCDLDPALANDAGNYDVEAWNYKWSSGYGSGEFPIKADPKAPAKKGEEHTTLKVKSAKLQPDGKTVVLEVDGLQPVMQMKITYNIAAADKTAMRDSIHNTIHELAEAEVTAR
jgi:glucose/arabinose dehydrogenase